LGDFKNQDDYGTKNCCTWAIIAIQVDVVAIDVAAMFTTLLAIRMVDSKLSYCSDSLTTRLALWLPSLAGF
jgi:hypothetical protein